MPASKDSQAVLEAQDGNVPLKSKKPVVEAVNSSPEEFLKNNIKQERDVRVSIKKITETAFRVNFMKVLVTDEDLQVKDWRIIKSQFLVVVTNDDGTMDIVDRTLSR